jgi:hypothetical protein
MTIIFLLTICGTANKRERKVVTFCNHVIHQNMIHIRTYSRKKNRHCCQISTYSSVHMTVHDLTFIADICVSESFHMPT